MTTSLLTVADVAKHLRMSERFVLDEIRRGNLRATKAGNQWRIDPPDLAAYKASNSNVQPTGRTG